MFGYDRPMPPTGAPPAGSRRPVRRGQLDEGGQFARPHDFGAAAFARVARCFARFATNSLT